MNTNHIHQIQTATLTTVIAFVACASTATPAFAGEPHDNGDGGARTSTAAPYAMPLDALDGLTLAQYVQNHEADDPRTFTVV